MSLLDYLKLNTLLSSSGNYIGVGWSGFAETWDFIQEAEDGILYESSVQPRYNHQQRWELDVLRREPTYRRLHYTSLPRYRIFLNEGVPTIIGFPLLLKQKKFLDHVKILYKCHKLVVSSSEVNEEHYSGSMGPSDALLALKIVNSWT